MNINQAKNVLSRVDKIYIDTCSLMRMRRRVAFLDNYRDTLLTLGKKITIHDSVMRELKMLQQRSEDIAWRAESAYKWIVNNSDVFEFNELEDVDEATVYGDHELMSELFNSDNKEMIMFISNDNNLNNDIYSLRKFESCPKRNIYLYYLTGEGEIKVATCVTNDRNYNTSIPDEESKNANNSVIFTIIGAIIEAVMVGSLVGVFL